MKFNQSTKELRKYGLVMTVPLLVISLLLLWKGKPACPYFFAAACFFLLSGLLIPKILAPVEWAWMKLAFYMGIIVTHVILFFFFFLVITPIGLIMKLLGKDPLLIKRDERQSFWIPTETDGPGSRPTKPY